MGFSDIVGALLHATPSGAPLPTKSASLTGRVSLIRPLPPGRRYEYALADPNGSCLYSSIGQSMHGNPSSVCLSAQGVDVWERMARHELLRANAATRWGRELRIELRNVLQAS